MKTLNNFKKAFLFVAVILVATSCSENIMDNFNKNPNDPSDVPSRFIIPELAASTAGNTTAGDLSLYASVYMELETGVHNQLYNAEIRTGEPISSTTYNNPWEQLYVNIRNAITVIEKCSDGGSEEGSYASLGIAQVYKAVNLATLTNLFGDVPFKQTAIFDEKGMPVYTTPEIDSQQDAYTEIFSLLDAAIENFSKNTDASLRPGSYDLIYGGNMALWTKAAYGLKARYTLQLLHRSSNVNQDLQKIIDYADLSFASAAEALTFDHYDGNGNFNPLFGFTYVREGIAASKSYVNKLIATDDYRCLAFLAWNSLGFQAEEPSDIDNAAPNGRPTESQGNYDEPISYYALTAPVHIMSYHELLYIKAEALVRLGGAANIASAKSILNQAVIASYLSLNESIVSADEEYFGAGFEELDADLAQDFFDNSVSARFDADPLAEVILQKYMSCHGAAGEPLVAYNDYRRLQALGEAGYITLENSLNSNSFPYRFSYGNDDVLMNPNIKAAYGDGQYVYSEKVWWAGGSR